MKPVRVLLVDDHALFRRGLASLFQTQEEFQIVGEAQDGKQALEKARELRPDVILMDVSMPGVGGLEATRLIMEALPSVKIVMLTIAEEDESLFEAIKSGARGYLLKRLEPHELFEMLRGVVKGETPFPRGAATKILGEFARLAQRRHGSAGTSPEETLSGREREVLEFLTRGATNKEIASSLGISENTVKNHLKSILGKLHLQNRVQAAAYAFRNNLVPQPTPES